LQFLSTQHKDVVHQISTGESVACFAMSELGHGSATALNETTATFDASTGEFVIHTPSTTAQKYWIGVSLLSANWTIVYARLITNGKDYGVHPFLVPLRDRVSGPLRPGVHVSTIGKKMGLDGIDNGRIFFDHYRVPRNYLLDKIATVSAEGHYSTPYTSENKRFAAIFAGLVIARIALGTIAAGYGRMACEIAIRYAHTRHAFAIAKGGPEVPIITYASHQLRLFPRLANAFAISFLGHACKAPLLKNNVEELMHGKDLHLDACVLKAFGSWYTQDALQEAREACGGQGYLMRNLLPQWRKDIDILVTLDGDNTLLCQQITKVLIDRLRSHVTHQNLLQNVGEVLTAEFRANLGFLRTVGLHSHASLLRMFRAREDVLLYTLVKNMRSDAGRTKGSESDGQFRGWNNNIQLVNRVAVAHAERRMAEEFSRGIGHLRSHPRVAEAFDNLFYLFCFTRIHDDPWFVAGKIISRSQWEEVGQRIGEVCRAIAPYSLTLVESFRTPAWMLHGTIAEDWVRVNDRNNELD
jgi:acyl-CoA oxidase